MAKRKYKDPDNFHTSYYPAYYRDPRTRTLAWILPIYDEQEYIVAYTLYILDREKYIVTSYDELVSWAFHFKLDVYTNKLFGNGAFIWTAEAISKGAKIHVSPSSKIANKITVFGTSHNKRSQIQIVSVSGWGYNSHPDKHFMGALKNVLDYYGHGIYTSAASLGQNAIADWHRQQKLPRYHRPSRMLRHKLFKYGSGGRADDWGLAKQVKAKFQIDLNNSYAAQAKSGVPVLGCESIGLVDHYTDDTTLLEEYTTAFVQARITVTADVGKFAPFYLRDELGELHWVTDAGVYEGWWWSNMLARCMQRGCKVEIAFAWCWRELDTFLSPWVDEIVAMRQHFKEEGKELEEDISKRIIVSAIGCFGTHDCTVTIVTAENAVEGDEPFLDLQVDGYDSMYTGYYLHTEDKPDANHLTQVAYYIIMRNNIALFDRALEEEQTGNLVIKTYYDAIYLERESKLPTGRGIGEWKNVTKA